MPVVFFLLPPTHARILHTNIDLQRRKKHFGLRRKSKSKGKAILLSIPFVAGIVLIFCIVGLLCLSVTDGKLSTFLQIHSVHSSEHVRSAFISNMCSISMNEQWQPHWNFDNSKISIFCKLPKAWMQTKLSKNSCWLSVRFVNWIVHQTAFINVCNCVEFALLCARIPWRFVTSIGIITFSRFRTSFPTAQSTWLWQTNMDVYRLVLQQQLNLIAKCSECV